MLQLYTIILIIIILLIYYLPASLIIYTSISILNFMFLKQKQNLLKYKKEGENELQLTNILYDDSHKNIIFNNIITKIQNILNTENQLFYTYNDIYDAISYTEDMKIINFNCHLGQRKLVLSEIQFYSNYLDYQDNIDNLIIYVGSANGEHTPAIIKLFPKIKLILIDPNYHNINYDYSYIYQNNDIIDQKNTEMFLNIINITDPKLGTKLYNDKKGAQRLLNVKFMFSDNKYDVLKNLDKNEMKKQMELFNNKSDDLIKNIFNDYKQIFIIQDYANTDMITKIKNSIKIYSSEKKINVLYISDLRTTMLGKEPTDVDIIWNNIQQGAFLKILNPDVAMLKFRPPFLIDMNIINDFLDKIKSDNIENIKYNDGLDEEKNKLYLMIINDVKKLSKYYDISKIFDKGIYKYFNHHKIFIQAWSPISSSESRMILLQKNFNEPNISYNSDEWSDKFYFNKYYRMYMFYNNFIDIISRHNLLHEYDGCFDCSIEIKILSEYLNKKENLPIKVGYYDNNIENMLKNREFCIKLINLQHEINKITYYSLKSYKCSHHGGLLKKPDYVYMYNIPNIKIADAKIQQIKITKSNFEIKRKYNVEDILGTLKNKEYFVPLHDKNNSFLHLKKKVIDHYITKNN